MPNLKPLKNIKWPHDLRAKLLLDNMNRWVSPKAESQAQMRIIEEDIGRINPLLYDFINPKNFHPSTEFPQHADAIMAESPWYLKHPGERLDALKLAFDQLDNTLGFYTGGTTHIKDGVRLPTKANQVYVQPDVPGIVAHEWTHPAQRASQTQVKKYKDFSLLNDLVAKRRGWYGAPDVEASEAMRRRIALQDAQAGGRLHQAGGYLLDPNSPGKERVADLVQLDFMDPEYSSNIVPKEVLKRIRGFLKAHPKLSKFGLTGAGVGLATAIPNEADAARLNLVKLKNIFSATPERRKLLEKVMPDLEALVSQPAVKRVYLGGSAASSKPDPKDVDLIIRYSEADPEAFDELLDAFTKNQTSSTTKLDWHVFTDDLASRVEDDLGGNLRETLAEARKRYGSDYQWKRIAGAGGIAAGLAATPDNADATTINGKPLMELLGSVANKFRSLPERNAKWAEKLAAEDSMLADAPGPQIMKRTNLQDELYRELDQLSDMAFGSGVQYGRQPGADPLAKSLEYLTKKGITEDEAKALYHWHNLRTQGQTQRMVTPEELGKYNAWAGMEDQAGTQPFKEATTPNPKPEASLPKPALATPKDAPTTKGNAHEVLSNYLRSDNQHAKRLMGYIKEGRDGDWALQQLKGEIHDMFKDNPQNAYTKLLAGIYNNQKQGVGLDSPDAVKAVLQITGIDHLERLAAPGEVKKIAKWAGMLGDSKIRGLLPVFTAGGAISFMLPDGRADAMPVSEAIPYTTATAKSVLGHTPMQHLDAYKLIGNKINLKLPTDQRRQVYHIVDMLTNERDKWNLIVKGKDEAQYAVPLTKDEFRSFIRASGTKEYLRRFKYREDGDQLAQATKSLGIRESKRPAMPKLMREFQAMEEREIQLLKDIDPTLVSKYCMFKAKGANGPSVYIPIEYARKLTSEGLGHITKYVRESLPKNLRKARKP